MKKPIRTLIVVLTLCLAAGTAVASTEPSAPSAADQQFLATLAAEQMPAPISAAKPPPPPNCPADWCTSADRAACDAFCYPCMGILSCNSNNCTESCICDLRVINGQCIY